MMWWAMWCAAVLAGSAGCAPAEPGLDLAPVDQAAPDDEGLSYAVPPMGGRYEGAPWLYLLADLPRESQSARSSERRWKRKMPSLSINNPMEVLRQRLMLEVARKQMREASQRQAVANRLFLQNVGKRGFWENYMPSHYAN
ncbi:diuretic hormone 45 isoform X1 [Plutella xylostella]|uniref:diuretic hormone 45 isoform X1 n=1 Tax=Plutella xylostella TaxID=51655 RepID=UPI0020329F94|nr:diuretic hormone 45 isoform X1 [Plutella xylostella]XP_037964158.2 diuretic hormone 45 isoform X1 [Plutella xylostella]